MFIKSFIRKKQLIQIGFFMLVKSSTSAQLVIPTEIINTEYSTSVGCSENKNTNTKDLSVSMERSFAYALTHFPELKNVHIKIRVIHMHSIAKTNPSFISMFLPKKNRTYIISISDKTAQALSSALIQNLPYNAQVGIFGHELSHVVEFSESSTLKSLGIGIRHLLPTYLDKFEYNTDIIAIKHGLGIELESWSSFIRNTYHTKYWRGSENYGIKNTHFERYMNPDTIEKYMTSLEK